MISFQLSLLFVYICVVCDVSVYLKFFCNCGLAGLVCIYCGLVGLDACVVALPAFVTVS